MILKIKIIIKNNYCNKNNNNNMLHLYDAKTTVY